MKPFVANETAIAARLPRQARRSGSRRCTFKPVNGGTAGVATLKVRSAKPGRLALKASHRATPGAADAAGQDGPRERSCARAPGPARAARRCGSCRPSSPRCTTSSPRTGVYDAGTGRAIMAWRKVAGLLAHLRRHRGRLRRPAQGPRQVQGPPPRRRPPRRGAAELAGARADRRRQGRADLPHVLGRAGDADRPRQVPRLHEDAGHQRQGHGRLELLHPRLRDPRLRLGAAVQRQPRLPARAGRRTRASIYDWLRIGDVVWVEP